MSPQTEPDASGTERSVPLFSGLGGRGMLFAGFMWATAVRLVALLMDVELDLLSWTTLVLLAGSVMLTLWSVGRRRHFRNPVTEQDLLDLFEEVKADLRAGNDIELWHCNVDRLVFVSTSDPLFKAILFSESAVIDILNKREKGKILLAKAVMEIDKKNRAAQFLKGILLFIGTALLYSLTYFDVFDLLIPYADILIVTIVLSIVGILVIAPVVVSRKSDEVDRTLERLYGTPPDVAMMEVLFGVHVSSETIKKKKHDKEHWRGQRRIALRNAGTAAVVLAPVSFVAFLLSHSASLFAFRFSAVETVVTCGGAFIIVYFASFAWSALGKAAESPSTEWGFQLPIAKELQDFLSQQEGYEKLTVRSVKGASDEEGSLVFLRLKPDYREEPLHEIGAGIIDDLENVELLGPLALAEMKMSESENGRSRAAALVLVISAVFLAVSLFWSVSVSGIYGLLSNIIPIVIIYSAVSMIPLVYMELRKQKSIVQAELDIARRYPKYREALRTLIEKNRTLPYGMTSYKTRLERIDRQLGIHADQGVSA